MMKSKIDLKIDDHVIMVGCLEAKSHVSEVWKVASEPWTVCGSEVVLLAGYSGGFSTKFLQKIDQEIYHTPKPINPAFVEFEKMFRATQQVTHDEFVELVSDFFGGDQDYAEGCWPQWWRSPIGYMFSRSPLEQGEKLFELVRQKANGKDIAECCFSNKMRSYKRFREVQP